MSAPRITVILPVRNGERYLAEAIASIRDQSFADWELLVIDDGSTDGSSDIAARAAAGDARIVVHRRPAEGIVGALNDGLARARGDLIARLDADDRADRGRFMAQVTFLDRHPQIGICGTACRLAGEGSGTWTMSERDEQIRARLLFANPLLHPTVMFRRALIERCGPYDPAFEGAEDYDLWERFSRVTKLANLTAPLVTLRLHQHQYSTLIGNTAVAASQRIHARQIEALGIVPTALELENHLGITWAVASRAERFVDLVDVWLQRLREGNQRTAIYPSGALDHELARRWRDVTAVTPLMGKASAWRRYRRSPLSRRVESEGLAAARFVRASWDQRTARYRRRLLPRIKEALRLGV